MANNRFRLDNQFYIEVFINDQPMYYNPSDFEEISIVQNALSFMPTLRITLHGDATGRFMNVYQPGDLNIIDIEIGNERSSARTIKNKWRVFGAPSYEPSGKNMERVSLIAILDAVRYFRDIVPRAFKGRSSDAFKWIAGECGLFTENFRGESTIYNSSDSQWWLPRRNTFCGFASDICDHAWQSNSSVFSFGLDEEFSLYLSNLAELAQKEPKGQFAHISEQIQPGKDLYNILDYEIKSAAGALNNWAAYRYKVTQEERTGEFSEYAQLNATRQSNYFEIGIDIDDFVEEGRVHHFPLDCGNVHDHFEKAYHQNIRGRATYGTVVDVLTEMLTNEDLFSTVRLDLLEPQSRGVSRTNQMYSGNYVIGAKTRTIRGSRYYEKHRLVTQGRMLDNPGMEK